MGAEKVEIAGEQTGGQHLGHDEVNARRRETLLDQPGRRNDQPLPDHSTVRIHVHPEPARVSVRVSEHEAQDELTPVRAARRGVRGREADEADRAGMRGSRRRAGLRASVGCRGPGPVDGPPVTTSHTAAAKTAMPTTPAVMRWFRRLRSRLSRSASRASGFAGACRVIVS